MKKAKVGLGVVAFLAVMCLAATCGDSGDSAEVKTAKDTETVVDTEQATEQFETGEEEQIVETEENIPTRMPTFYSM